MEITKQYQDPIEQEYFEDIPEKYHSIITSNLNLYKEKDTKTLGYKRRCHFKAIFEQKHELNVTFFELTGGIYAILKENNPLCTGKTNSDDGYDSLLLKELKNIKNQHGKSNFLKKLVKNYKIHLMPKGSCIEDFDELIQLIKDDKELGAAIVTFKIAYIFEDDETIANNFNKGKEIFPKIVIYAAAGKKNAQLVLNKIYNAFKHKEGLNIPPRYNQKVTSYIYYAQGNGDDKIDDEYKSFFEQPHMVHYKSDITGTVEDYNLNIPLGEKRLPVETSWQSFWKKTYSSLLTHCSILLSIVLFLKLVY